MNRSIFFAAVLYLLFVVYGSLVPLEFREIPLETAINQFKNIPYLKLGAASRADWIANILLYIPLSFMAAAACGRMIHPLARLILSLSVFIFCLALAVAVEFTQQFFPPRTVSLNDLIAEGLGTAIGLGAWLIFGHYFSRLYNQLWQGSLFSVHAGIVFYLLLYIGLSLFPFDFVTSFEELDEKLVHSDDALILPFDTCSAEPLRCGVKLLAEILVLIPLGLLFCYLPYLKHRFFLAVLVGFFLGLAIEIAQVFLLSGSGQGISIATRIAGLTAGTSIYQWTKRNKFSELMPHLRRSAQYLTLPYLVLIMSVNGWFSSGWLTQEKGLGKLSETRFLPLYYYYYTSEGVALVSLLSNLGMYMPLGLLCWANFFRPNHEPKPAAPHWLYIGLFAALFALATEIGKSFLNGKHTDPSDVWLAFIAAAGSYEFMNRFLPWLHRDKTATRPSIIENASQSRTHAAEKPPIETAQPAYDVDKRWRIVSLLLGGFIAADLFTYPVATAGLGFFLIGYIALLAHFPYAWLIVIPAVLPIMDFAPWTGRFFFDEFDLIILTTLLAYYWRKPHKKLRPIYTLKTFLLLSAFSILYIISLLRGFLPLQPIDANAFSSYYSNYNSLRVGKGVLWALCMWPLLYQALLFHRRVHLDLGYGILVGFAGVVTASCRERFLFSGLFNFSNDYRTTALFSGMHTGGGEIDAYFSLTLPFIAVLFLHSSRIWLTRSLGIVLFITGLYALLVTYSRSAFLAFVFELVVFAFALFWRFMENLTFNRKKLLVLPVLMAIALGVAMPVLKGSFFQERFSKVDSDADRRVAHWRDAIAMIDDDLPSRLVGMGIGSYPRNYLWRNGENIFPAMYQIAIGQSSPYLKLSAGKKDALYLGQRIDVTPHAPYRLSVDLRSKTFSAALDISLCEKSLLYSFKCNWYHFAEPSQGNQWRHFEQSIDSGEIGQPIIKQEPGFLFKRPVQLSLNNGGGDTIAEVDNVSLTDASGRNLIKNGDFSQGMDFWFFSTENHWPWHTENLPVSLLFEQGWLGAGAFFLLFAAAVYNCCRRLRQNPFNVILLSSFSGFIVVGLFTSPFDYPRLTFLFFLLLFLALASTSEKTQRFP